MTYAERLSLDRARAAVQNGDSATLRELSKQLEGAVFDQGRFSDDTVRELSETIKSDAYARLTDGVLLIKIFEYNLGLMTESQAEEFGSALISFVPRACDKTAAFLAIELLAELWTDRRSVDAIRAVRDASVSETTLALVAHGFHWLAKKSKLKFPISAFLNISFH